VSKPVFKISDTFSLPLDFVTSTQAILAKKRVGKSYTGSVQAEELLKHGQQVIVIDPTGAWWGLRSSADGKSAGFPITIFGGRHADIPLEPGAGSVIAKAVVKDRFSAILDLQGMSKTAANRLVGEFLATLYRENSDPVHVFIDEADLFAPQKPWGDDAVTLGATNDIVRRGGILGIGCTLITQRAAVINKDVISQVDMLTLLRQHYIADLEQIVKWVTVVKAKDKAKEMVESLPSLKKGEAWFWNPEIDLFLRASVRQKETFDSGRTPKVGETVRPPKVLAPIDHARLGETIAALVEKQKESDPGALRGELARAKAKVHSLEVDLKREREKIQAPISVAAKTIEKPVLTPALVKRVEQSAEKLTAALTKVLDANPSVIMALKDVSNAITQGMKVTVPPTPPRAEIRAITKAIMRASNAVTEREFDGAALTGPETRLLESLAWFESIGLTTMPLEAVAFMAGYSPSGSAFTNPRGSLRSKGLVDYPSPGAMSLTDAGRAAAPPVTTPVTTQALHEAVLRRLAGPETKLLKPLLEVYPAAMTVAELAEASGYSADGSAFTNPRGKLRTLGVVTYPAPGQVRAADLLFLEGR
jgi:hypothetical protein